MIIGFNQEKKGVRLTHLVENSIGDFETFPQRHGIKPQPWIYVGNGESFGVDKNGYVGNPYRLSTDMSAPKRPGTALPLAEDTGKPATSSLRCRGSKCFITTAVCRSLGLGDDCPAPRTPRGFRDDVLARTADGRADIEHYHATAPRIVAGIKARHDAAEIYARLYEQDIVPALGAIGRGEFDTAHRIYRDMFERSRRRYP